MRRGCAVDRDAVRWCGAVALGGGVVTEKPTIGHCLECGDWHALGSCPDSRRLDHWIQAVGIVCAVGTLGLALAHAWGWL